MATIETPNGTHVATVTRSSAEQIAAEYRAAGMITRTQEDGTIRVLDDDGNHLLTIKP